jgi:hypothetical protein
VDSARIHRLNVGDRFPAGCPGMLILGPVAGVVFRPLTVLRLVRVVCGGLLAGGLPGAGPVGCAVTGPGLVRPRRRVGRWRNGTGWPIPARGASLRAGGG